VCTTAGNTASALGALHTYGSGCGGGSRQRSECSTNVQLRVACAWLEKSFSSCTGERVFTHGWHVRTQHNHVRTAHVKKDSELKRHYVYGAFAEEPCSDIKGTYFTDGGGHRSMTTTYAGAAADSADAADAVAADAQYTKYKRTALGCHFNIGFCTATLFSPHRIDTWLDRTQNNHERHMSKKMDLKSNM
jgi:hypothetical protein